MSDQVSAPRLRPGRASLRHDGVIVFTPELVVQSWDPRLEQLFGIPVGDAIGRHITELLLTPDDRDRRFAELEARGTWRGRARLNGRCGLAVIDVISWALRSPDGGVAGYASTYRAVTPFSPQIADPGQPARPHVASVAAYANGVAVPLWPAMTVADTTADAEARATYAVNVRLARKLAGVSQDKLAELIGAPDHNEISRYEHARRLPGIGRQALIAAALEKPLGWFWEPHDDEATP